MDVHELPSIPRYRRDEGGFCEAGHGLPMQSGTKGLRAMLLHTFYTIATISLTLSLFSAALFSFSSDPHSSSAPLTLVLSSHSPPCPHAPALAL